MTERRRMIVAIGGPLALFLVYLFSWPVPVDPVAWDAPADAGLVDPFEANDRLRGARLIDIAPHEGPEDIAGGPDSLIYTGTSDGRIIRLSPTGGGLEVFADVGGRPLGLDFDADGNLLVANATVGLQQVTPGGEVRLLTNTVSGEPFFYANDVATAADGRVFFTNATTRFNPADFAGTANAARLDVIEHGGRARVLKFDPGSEQTTVVVDGLEFANGVAISDDQRFLVIAETGSYRLLRHWLEGPDAGSTEVLIDNLPGLPDNVNNGLNDRFWVGLVVRRNAQLDAMSDKPWLRKLVLRLPPALQPVIDPPSHVFSINGDGEVLMNLQDTGSRLPALTGVYESSDALWLSTLFGTRTARLDKRDLAYP
jgi:sugar lactone lactonase YvrE